MPYKAKGKCVYKADTGKKVGCTKGPVSKYLAALHANVPDAKHENLNKENNMNEANNTKPAINPETLKKIVQYLAKEAEHFQNYVGVDASYDVEFGTIDDIITDSKNKKLQNFWRSLSDKQQMEVFNMIHQYLLNKEIKKDPEYFGDETVQPINYVLSAKTKAVGPAPKGDVLSKLVKKLAKDAEDWMNYLDLDSPEQITFHEFVDRVIEDPDTSPKIKNYWNSLRGKQQEDLFEKVVAVLEKKYGSSDEMYEGRNLSKIAKKVIKESRGAPLMLNGKEVEKGSLEVDGVDSKDYPDFSDAYIAAGNYIDGTPLNDEEIAQLEDENYGLAHELAHGSFLEESDDWRDDPKLSRDWEKSDVSQDEFERSRGFGRYGRGGGYSPRPKMVGITFFDVPPGKEGEARRVGLTQFKSGKWGYKHQFDKNVISVASDREKSNVSAAEQSFGKGRYWEPRN